jgi:hypothetical protein
MMLKGCDAHIFIQLSEHLKKFFSLLKQSMWMYMDQAFEDEILLFLALWEVREYFLWKSEKSLQVI